MVLKDVSREVPGRSVLQQAPAPREMNYCKNSPTCLQMKFGEVRSQRLVSEAALAQSLRQSLNPAKSPGAGPQKWQRLRGRQLPKALLCLVGLKRKDIYSQPSVSDLRSLPCDGRSAWVTVRGTWAGRRTPAALLAQHQASFAPTAGSPPFSDTAFPGLCFCGVCASSLYLKALLAHGFHCLLTSDKWLFWIRHVLASAANIEFLSVSHLNACLLQIWSRCLVLFIAICPGLVKALVLNVQTHHI
uniref:Uncharacterized protein n=1 Tax=Pipistrellus kuhlii TaxID=59472 RepID=A0A7J7VBK0_PIPKU|nr:hypothetical protein mPipKuh1_008495 [Pipistrellus kuhlii]